MPKLFSRRSREDVETELSQSEKLDNLLRKLRRIEIVSKRLASEIVSGQYRSVFRGQGIEFDEVREYAEGDDVRAIDWNVTARSGKPYVKRFSEERERSLLFMLDVSASNLFGSQLSRLETTTEIAASLMFSAIKNNDKIGLLTFANGVKKFFPPKRGRNRASMLVKEMLQAVPTREPTDLNTALEFVDKTLKRRSIVLILSDFYAPNLEEALTYCVRKHEVIALSVSEPFEEKIPRVGFINLRDPETGREIELDAGSSAIRQAISRELRGKRTALVESLKKVGVTPLFIENGADYVPVLKKFFRSRR